MTIKDDVRNDDVLMSRHAVAKARPEGEEPA
jgi:hypothetical protein